MNHYYVIHCKFDFTVYTTACGCDVRLEETPTTVLSGALPNELLALITVIFTA